MEQGQRLNLEWTVGDMDRLNFAARNPGLTAEGIAHQLSGTAFACSPQRIREICRAFNVKIRPSALEVVR